MRSILRRLRGALKNGLMWSGAWALATVGFSALFRVLGLGQAIPFLQAVPSLLIGGAVVGFVAGVGFSLALAAAFRHRELQEISVSSFSLVGASVAGVLVPGLFYAPLLLSGTIVPPIVLVTNLVGAAILGGSTAFGMIRLAKAAPASISESDPTLLSPGDHALDELEKASTNRDR